MKYEEYRVNVYKNGDVFWNNNKGESHRLGGLPAVELTNGTKFWCKDGKAHREDGPAMEYADGYKSWYLEGKNYTEKEYNKEILKRKNPQTCSGKEVVIDEVTYLLTPKV